MDRSIAAGLGLAATVTIAGFAAAPATAAPSVQRVRIEGRTATLFEGPIRTDGHTVKASSDNRSRPCGTASGTSFATPTAAADDAMRLSGQSFDGRWGAHQDYFVTRFGPDGQDPGNAAYWGIVVNGIYTSIGGCQVRLNAGDSTLWLYDAFNAKPQLRLDGPGGSIGEGTADVEGGPSTAPVQQRFDVALHQPFTVTVVRSASRFDVGAPGDRTPAAGVAVAPVSTDGNGWQTVLRGHPSATPTGGDGHATMVWSTPGWKRIKADGDGYVRSNRLDVCVLGLAGEPCGPAPADSELRVAPASTLPDPTPEGGGGSGSLVDGSEKAAPKVSLGASTVSGLRVTTDGHASGLVNVRWTVAGSRLKAWRIESRTKGRKGARWKTVARGDAATTAMLDLPIGRTAQLRIHLTGPSGTSATRALPDVVVPTDDRVRSVRFGGRWARDRDERAWRLTTTRMRAGATLTARVVDGRPTLVVRADRKPARIALRVGTAKPQRLTIRGRKDGRTLLVSGRRSAKAGTVRVEVLSGTVHVDGVAARS